MSKATPTPWRVGKAYGAVVGDAPNPDGRPGSGHDDVEAYGGHLVCESTRKGDAELIVRAVNAHAPLVEALRECLDELKHYWANAGIDATQDLEQAREALRLAEGDAS